MSTSLEPQLSGSVSGNMQCSVLSSFPRHWFNASAPYEELRRWQYEDVDISGAEGAGVSAQLLESMSGVEVCQVQRIHHPLLWRRFNERCSELRQKCGGDANVLRLWHGTGSAEPSTILRSESGPSRSRV